MSDGALRAVPGFLAAILMSAAPALGATVTGDPSSDAGWSAFGNSLSSGVYVRGSANYAYDTYSTGFAIQAGSNLEITDANDSALDWLAGDTVLGVGGKFNAITAGAAGWGSFSGGAVNSLLGASSGPKLQVKFGTDDATWSTSTTAPGSGNGNSSSSNGGGRVQIRTSAYFQTGSPNPGQTEPWTWDGNSGQLLVLDKDSHIDWDGASAQPSKYTARMIWNYDTNLGYVTSWQLLLNVSLLERQTPGDFTGIYPAIGDLAVLTVQDGDNSYTDALVAIAPAPGSVGLLGLACGFAARRRRSR